MDDESIRRGVGRYTWYHEIDLGAVITPGHPEFRGIWDQTRKVRSLIDYSGKAVLDICAYDGMFSFEAEKLGASLVVATDCCYRQYGNFLFCRQALGSNVLPYYNVSPYNLEDRLDVFLTECLGDGDEPYSRLFDIVQHLGLLYHVRDPLLSLSQARSVIRTGGHLLLETAGVEGDESKMVFNGVPMKGEYWPTCGARHTPPSGFDHTATSARVMPDSSTWWCPTVTCLKEMLRACLFEVVEGSVSTKPENSSKEYAANRIALVARAVGYDSVDPRYASELKRKYRNPGLNPHDRPPAIRMA